MNNSVYTDTQMEILDGLKTEERAGQNKLLSFYHSVAHGEVTKPPTFRKVCIECL